MKVSKYESLTQPYVLTANDLKKLCRALQILVGKTKFEIECGDTFKRRFSTLPELLRFENSPKKDIKTLLIKADSQNLETSVWIKFDKNSSRNIYLSVEGEEDIAIKLNECIEECLSVIKPWYALLAQINFLILLVVIEAFFLIILLLGIVILRPYTASPSSSASQPVVQVTITSVLNWFFLSVFGYTLNWMRSTFFPMGVFALGQGVKRHKDKELIRTTVIVAFVISFISGILATLLFAL